MNETFKLSGMQRSNIELERQRHLAKWLVKSSPHMAAAAAASAATTTATQPPTASSAATTNPGSTVGGAGAGTVGGNQAAAAAACNGGAAVGAHHGHISAAVPRKPKLRRFNSHDISSNMFSVADFENARLARRNEIELYHRLGGGSGLVLGYSGFCDALNGSHDYSTGDSKASKGSSESQQEALPADVFLERNPLPRVVRILHASKCSNETLQSSSSHGSSTAASSSSSTGVNPVSGGTNASSGNIGNGTGNGTGTHSSSSGGSGTGNGTGSGPGSGSGSGPGPAAGHQINNGRHSSSSSNGGTTPPGHDELFLLYRLVRQRNIYHGHNAKTQASQRKKTVLIPQEFPGYFSLLNEKGLPTATQYGSLIQLVRERVYKFASVDNMPAFTESSPNSTSSPTHEGCLPITKGRPQYVKTTARGGQVFKLLAVFEDGKQEQANVSQHGNVNVAKSHLTGYMGREKEKNRYAQLMNENRQVMYVPLSTKGKFYEIEPGIPQLLQKLGDAQRKLNPECVYRLGVLVTAAKQLPLTLRYISGPGGHDIPEQLCISQVSKEDVVVGCSIEDVDTQTPLQLRKFYPSRNIQLVKSYLGFDSEQRMLANTNVQNMLKFCQFNCDPFLKLVEIELIQRSERSGSKNREGLRILKPLHFPKILRREKSTMAAAHEKEKSIIFLSKSDLENLEAKEAAAAAAASAAQSESSLNRISERMRVFQSTKKKWFGRHHPQQQQQQIEKQPSSLDLDEQAKRLSMERYTDMSKLLQERFGSDPEQPEQDGISLNSTGASDTETTMLTTMLTTMEPNSLDTMLQKSMSLQDIELLNGQCKQRPDLLASHNHSDAISEAGTELEDVENQTPPPQSFITEKLYNEFHVKTRQYSKSSSSLHQLRHFSLPQKLQLHEAAEKEKRHLMLLKAQQQSLVKVPITGRRAAGGVCLLGGGLNHVPILPPSLVEDDLPYSSVRDSLVISGDGCLRSDSANRPVPALDYTKENIYAEICPSHTADTFSGATQSTQMPDDDGDYASLKYSVNGPQSVSRIEVNGAATAVKSSAISYHTVYLGEEPLGERHAAHITTVELAGEDNIYNTLK
ncbi:uncharacterized protein LOC108092656 [Drosophila ficusphila]|uniref:uncharacterized protein LOC108092656 n=1 Tax=Drosophila ficusphila TaxID=30025 RepID=UPI001C8A564B|nr:uncharacterized protein LOC108092656 [Drosophila ficusphila]XP_017047804.2 uncharacterized protein LOC108092656 [Drosophila ficusphila]XP_017047805.2 uncharacterized protein LOC108092656 [Drosophila ficusphila]XP_017047806.2 uncharacterized protein LOC108092656 [Drosophila ficusphila]